MRLEIWRKIGLSDVFAQCYALVVVHATIGIGISDHRVSSNKWQRCHSSGTVAEL